MLHAHINLRNAIGYTHIETKRDVRFITTFNIHVCVIHSRELMFLSVCVQKITVRSELNKFPRYFPPSTLSKADEV